MVERLLDLPRDVVDVRPERRRLGEVEVALRPVVHLQHLHTRGGEGRVDREVSPVDERLHPHHQRTERIAQRQGAPARFDVEDVRLPERLVVLRGGDGRRDDLGREAGVRGDAGAPCRFGRGVTGDECLDLVEKGSDLRCDGREVNGGCGYRGHDPILSFSTLSERVGSQRGEIAPLIRIRFSKSDYVSTILIPFLVVSCKLLKRRSKFNGDGVELNTFTVDLNDFAVDLNDFPVNLNGDHVDRNAAPVDLNGDRIDGNAGSVELNGKCVELNGETVAGNAGPVKVNAGPVDLNGSRVARNGTPIDLNAVRVDLNANGIDRLPRRGSGTAAKGGAIRMLPLVGQSHRLVRVIASICRPRRSIRHLISEPPTRCVRPVAAVFSAGQRNHVGPENDHSF